MKFKELVAMLDDCGHIIEILFMAVIVTLTFPLWFPIWFTVRLFKK